MKTASFRTGFTLIEVMVATAVLLIMVLMVGSLFRSAASSWDSGYARADGGSLFRAVAGALARDLSTAVEISSKSGSSIRFVCFKPGKTGADEELHEIEYSLTRSKGTRTDLTLNEKTDLYVADNDSPITPDFHLDYLDPLDSNLTDRSYESSGNYEKWTVPAVKLRCKLTRTGSFSGLSVLSLGPDGKEGLSDGAKDNDDIVVK